MQSEFPFNKTALTLPKQTFTQQFNFCLCLSLQVALLPAAPHRGPDHLPAGLSGAGQAVSLAAHHVSLKPIYREESFFCLLRKEAICSKFHFYVLCVIFVFCTIEGKGREWRRRGRWRKITTNWEATRTQKYINFVFVTLVLQQLLQFLFCPAITTCAFYNKMLTSLNERLD